MKIYFLLIVLIFLFSCSEKSKSDKELKAASNRNYTEQKAADSIYVELEEIEKNKVEFRNTDLFKPSYQTKQDTLQLSKLINTDLTEDYFVATSHDPYFITGYFNNDEILDTAIFFRKSGNIKEGLLIKHGGGNPYDYYMFGAGKEVLNQNFDEFSWVGIFKKINRGEKVASNIDESGEIITEELPDSLTTTLVNDGVYIHAFESCGGGIIYLENNEYSWIQQE
jgi:hypothetical protein